MGYTAENQFPFPSKRKPLVKGTLSGGYRYLAEFLGDQK